MRILHVLYQSHPNISGSSTRSRAIIKAQNKIGLYPVVITSPFQVGLKQSELIEIIDGVKYYRTYIDDDSFSLAKSKSLFTRIRKLFSIFKFTFQLYRIAKSEGAHVIHSHAMFYCALPAMVVSKLLKIKHVYEIRSDWSVNSNFTAGRTTKFILGKLEEYTASLCDHLVVISKGLKNKYQYYNQQLTIVPNAVDDDILSAGDSFKIPTKQPVLTIAYIGSVIELEGLEFVLYALSQIPAGKFKLIIAGDGRSLSGLKKLARELNLDNVQFLGKVAPERIPELYMQIDIIINYRRNEPVAHSVTPLKPLEAMAYKRLVVTSDVAGMTEVVTDGDTGVVVPANSPELLAVKLKKIHTEFDEYTNIIINGAAMVRQKKSWNSNAELYKNIYCKLLNCSGENETY